MGILLVLMVVIALFLVTLYKSPRNKDAYIKSDSMAYEPTTIANYFIQEKSSLGKLTSMKVIKLTYLAYSWFLAINKGEDTLLNEQPQAWKYGPVFNSLYHNLKNHGKSDIQSKLPTCTEEVITKDVSLFLDKIWDKYGVYTGLELSSLTHADKTPWHKSYVPTVNNIISDKIILEHYLPKLQ